MFEPRPAALAVSIALLGVLFIAGCASRQPPRGGPEGGPPGGGPGGSGGAALTLDGGRVARPVALLFAGMDTDRDYIIAQDELAAGIVREWASLPQSAQGNVPAIAIADWAGTVLGDPEALPNHLAFDVNLDGQVNETEFRTRLADEFAQLDHDHDGRLTRAEMLRDLPVRSQGQGGGMPSGGMQGGPPGGGGRPPR
ncbi:MAG: EF-hand domain-containing protein [Hyphomonas sp.]